MAQSELSEKALKKYPENWVEIPTSKGKYLVDTNKLARAKYLATLTANQKKN